MVKICDLFDARYGHSLELNRLKVVAPEEGVAFISRKMGDNGISPFLAPVLILRLRTW